MFLWEQPETFKFFILTPRSAFWFRAGISTVESDSGVSFSPGGLTLGIHFHKELTPPCKWHRGVLSAPWSLISSVESYQLRSVLSAPWSLISSAVSFLNFEYLIATGLENSFNLFIMGLDDFESRKIEGKNLITRSHTCILTLSSDRLPTKHKSLLHFFCTYTVILIFPTYWKKNTWMVMILRLKEAASRFTGK